MVMTYFPSWINCKNFVNNFVQPDKPITSFHDHFKVTTIPGEEFMRRNIGQNKLDLQKTDND